MKTHIRRRRSDGQWQIAPPYQGMRPIICETWHEAIARATRPVTLETARAHLAHLTSMGMSAKDIATAAGVNAAAITRLRKGTTTRALPRTLGRILATDLHLHGTSLWRLEARHLMACGMTHEEAARSVSRCYDTPLRQVERAIAFGVAA